MGKDFKNKIITLSGDPGAGKSTVMRKIKEKYIEQGYLEENIHIIKVGDTFRKIALEKIQSKYPDIKNITIAQINSDPKFAGDRDEFDRQLDTYIAKKGAEINSKHRPDDVYLIDSRLAWYNIPDSFSVRLTINNECAGERIFNDSQRGNEDKYKTVKDAIESSQERKQSEINRYRETYGIELENQDNYNLIIDTSYSDVTEISDLIMQCEELYEKDKQFPKTWASPKIFLPTQSIRETMEPQTSKSETLMEIKENIDKNGYDMSFPIEVKQKGNTILKTIIEGHHRNFASIMSGKTLVPYEEIGYEEDNTLTKKEMSRLHDYEDVFKFRYPSYPKIKEIEYNEEER